MGFGENLRALREARGWSGTELARQSGMGQGAINRLEKDPNPNPTMRNLVKLARALGVTVDALIADEQPHDFTDRLDDFERRIWALEHPNEGS